MFTSSAIHKIYLKLNKYFLVNNCKIVFFLNNINDNTKLYPIQDNSKACVWAQVMHETNKISGFGSDEGVLEPYWWGCGVIYKKITSSISFHFFVSKLASLLPLACGENKMGCKCLELSKPLWRGFKVSLAFMS